jgi:hypothetical protein
LDRILCFDTVIRGKDHDRLLLKAIAGCLGTGGTAVIDFHNWWHNPLRRLGILKENFSTNKSYSRKSAESLLHEAGILEFESNGFGSAFANLIPTTRLIYSFKGKIA